MEHRSMTLLHIRIIKRMAIVELPARKEKRHVGVFQVPVQRMEKKPKVSS